MIMVVFEFTVKPGQEQAYFAFADELQPILGKIDGFLGVERYQIPFDRNKFVSISTWRDEEAIRLWREQSEHKSTQKEGREILFAGYRIRVAQVVRDYCLESSPWQN